MGEAVEKPRSIRVNLVFSYINEILGFVIPLITGPYVARTLHEVGVGRFGYANSILTYFSLFAGLGFAAYGSRQIAAERDDILQKSRTFWDLFILKFITAAIALVVLYSVLFTVGFGENYTWLIFILSFGIVASPFGIGHLFSGEENFKILTISSILTRIVTLSCVFIFVKDESDVVVYAICTVAATIGVNLAMWPFALKRLRIRGLPKSNLKRHIKPSIMIFLPTLAVTVYSVFDKTMIGMLAQNPDYENGCYEEAYKLNSVALTLVTIISSVMISRNSHDYAKGRFDLVQEHLYKSSSYVWMMGTPLIVGFFVLSKSLSSWFLGEGYVEVPLLLIIMSVRFISSGFAVIFGDQLFIAIKKEKYPLIATSCAAVINVVLNYFLIPRYGATGAAITTAISEITVTSVYVILVLKGHYLSLRKILFLGWKNLIAALIMFVPIFFMERAMKYSVFSFLLITLTGAAVYFLCLFIMRDKFFLDNAKIVIGNVKEVCLKIFHKRKAVVAMSETESSSVSVDNANNEIVQKDEE